MRRLGDGAIIWINPDRIELSAKSIRTRKPKHVGELLDHLRITTSDMRHSFFNLFYRNQFALDEAAFGAVHSIQELPQFQNTRDIVRHMDDFTKSAHYRQVKSAVENQGSFRYKGNSVAAIDDIPLYFENYWRKLYHSMKSDGYDMTKAPDMGKCYVSADGALIKGENGRHRLAMARFADVRRFPLQVFGVSESWYRQNVGDTLDPSLLIEKLKEIETRYQ